nr:hypothetical protein [Pandoravirus massiliensis]
MSHKKLSVCKDLFVGQCLSAGGAMSPHLSRLQNLHKGKAWAFGTVYNFFFWRVGNSSDQTLVFVKCLHVLFFYAYASASAYDLRSTRTHRTSQEKETAA